MNDTIERSQARATFVLERTYPVPVQAVWHALEPDGGQTRLAYAEQGLHSDGLDSPEGREEGSGGLLGSHLVRGRYGRQSRFQRKAEFHDDRDSSDVGRR